MARWLQFLALALLVSMPLAALQAPVSGGLALAVFPPWWDADHSLRAAAAAGRPLGLGRLPFTIVVVPNLLRDGGGGLRTAGAWLVLPARGIAGCLFSLQKEYSR